ncbi:hypothetical protein Ahy_A09g046155 isoform A [Arachis hypogaea]|uniref:Argonaute linker 2 domain-containing protein n=1 Tax=Arachis hypogaea TaxID=3818 RepID=A0A445BNZ4_ARAHY|nr:hypothetical protein Ahy_A09g046155 isoform A [Arachis hypogaea]
MAPRLKKITALSTWMALLCEETLFLCSRLKASYHSRTHDDSDSSITGEAWMVIFTKGEWRVGSQAAKHELLLLSVAATSASSAAAAATVASHNLSLSSLASRDPSAAALVASTPIIAELSLPPVSLHLLPLTLLPSNLNPLSQFFSFSLKKSGRDGDDGTEEVTVLTLVEKSTLSMLQRASLVEKSRQKPPEKMRVLSDALKTSNYGSESMLQNCGISISTGFTQVDGRILPSSRRCSSNANFWNSEWERGGTVWFELVRAMDERKRKQR